ncbi:hypothetical protein BO78DRAFT_402572 [Aspergillus sclerotiicarbonarius CBS 121057]|uniref:Uncharacterized protein n=1 Tax=Aspergillus sclerotiicarbonarius (strain CBS 121057 / IBT 28362) TaxID=1448318 RepID=A0A319ET57_ASPSB|nr:hypothetical protein BO78DRAFT_402572 [Aspergillus sclerotiicarbonarius CBS 121057]
MDQNPTGLYRAQHDILFSGGEAWWPLDNSGLTKEVETVLGRVEGWCEEYALKGPTKVAQLSTSEKESIIRNLEGYWVQDLEWDKLMRSFPYPISLRVLQLLAQAMLTKDIMEKFFENPFWYFEGKADQQEKNQGGVCCARHLQHLYQQFFKTNPIRASRWKAETIRLANSTEPNQAEDLELGRYMKKHRDKAAASFAVSMLSCDPFRMLLEEVDSEKAIERDGRLRELYKNADEVAFTLGWHHRHCEYRTLASVGSTFDYDSKLADAHPSHHVDLCRDEPRLTERRILGIIRPALVVHITDPAVTKKEVLIKAEVLVEHGEWTKEDQDKLKQKFHERCKKILAPA